MAHTHTVKDDELIFTIDHKTREISRDGDISEVIIQEDHNCEKITFQLMHYLEGHDMSLCDRVEVHYKNTDEETGKVSVGIYECKDLTIDSDNSAYVTCTWLLSQNATRYKGSLAFALRFICTVDGEVVYALNTAECNLLKVAKGLSVDSDIVEAYGDVLKGWRDELKANQIISLQQTIFGTLDGGTNTWTAIMGDGRQYHFNVKNGSKGATGDKGNPGLSGKTPEKGVDYWTEADKAEIKAYVEEAILGGAW